MKQVRKLEKELFQTHPELKTLRPQAKGTGQLVLNLVDLQKRKLKHAANDVFEKLLKLQEEIEDDLRSLPPRIIKDQEKQVAFSEAIDNVTRMLGNVIKGQYHTSKQDYEHLQTLRKKLA